MTGSPGRSVKSLHTRFDIATSLLLCSPQKAITGLLNHCLYVACLHDMQHTIICSAIFRLFYCYFRDKVKSFIWNTKRNNPKI